jgi:FKBP-type peptidyl-prolyl cis-trans isomerase (trigger factor)
MCHTANFATEHAVETLRDDLTKEINKLRCSLEALKESLAIEIEEVKEGAKAALEGFSTQVGAALIEHGYRDHS